MEPQPNQSVPQIEMEFTPRLARVLEQAERLSAASYASHQGDVKRIGVEHVFLAALEDARAVPTQALDQMGVRDDLVERLKAIAEL